MSSRGLRALALCLIACIGAGCNARVSTPTTLKTVPIENKNTPSANTTLSMNTDGFMAGDMDAETVIANECLAAWRKELKGKTDEALKQLEDLNAKYPKMTTIAMMQGQICDHAGRTDESVRYFRDAVRGSEFSSLHQFKLGEALRKSGKSKEAIDAYRKVLKAAPDFVPAKTGLARALLEQDKSSTEAVELVEAVLTASPNDKEALEIKSNLSASK